MLHITVQHIHMGCGQLFSIGLAYVINRYRTIVRHSDCLFFHHGFVVFVFDGVAGIRVYFGNTLFDFVVGGG